MDYQLIVLLHMIVYTLFVTVSKQSMDRYENKTGEVLPFRAIIFLPFLMALPSFIVFEVLYWIAQQAVYELFIM
mgnify:CR=1 FL=1